MKCCVHQDGVNVIQISCYAHAWPQGNSNGAHESFVSSFVDVHVLHAGAVHNMCTCRHAGWHIM